MAGYNYYNQNQNLMNNLLRQKENIENLINQYNQPQAPVQNIINTGSSLDFEARILKDNEDISNIAINRRTLFVDENNKKISIKELDGSISKEYDIVIPLDEKDKKIIELENRLKEMEEKINNEYAKPSITNDECKKSNANVDGYDNTPTETVSKSISRTANRRTSEKNSTDV